MHFHLSEVSKKVKFMEPKNRIGIYQGKGEIKLLINELQSRNENKLLRSAAQHHIYSEEQSIVY